MEEQQKLQGTLNSYTGQFWTVTVVTLVIGTLAALYLTKILIIAAAISIFALCWFTSYLSAKVKLVKAELMTKDQGPVILKRAIDLLSQSRRIEIYQFFSKFSPLFNRIQIPEQYLAGATLGSFLNYLRTGATRDVGGTWKPKVTKEIRGHIVAIELSLSRMASNNPSKNILIPLKKEAFVALESALMTILLSLTGKRTNENGYNRLTERLIKEEAATITVADKTLLSVASVATISSFCPNAQFSSHDPLFQRGAKRVTNGKVPELLEQDLIGEVTGNPMPMTPEEVAQKALEAGRMAGVSPSEMDAFARKSIEQHYKQ